MATSEPICVFDPRGELHERLLGLSGLQYQTYGALDPLLASLSPSARMELLLFDAASLSPADESLLAAYLDLHTLMAVAILPDARLSGHSAPGTGAAPSQSSALLWLERGATLTVEMGDDPRRLHAQLRQLLAIRDRFAGQEAPRCSADTASQQVVEKPSSQDTVNALVLQNSLNTITGFAEHLMEEDGLEEPTRSDIGQFLEEADRVLDAIESLTMPCVTEFIGTRESR